MRTAPVLIAATLFGVLAATAATGETVKTHAQTHRADERKDGGKPHKSEGETRLATCPAPRLPGPLELAARLGAYESFVGIRTGQLDAWRDYTDALQAMAVGPEAERRTTVTVDEGDALDQSAALATDAMDDGERATRLLASVRTLEETLTPAQKTRLTEAGTLFPAKCADTLAEAGGKPAKDVPARH